MVRSNQVMSSADTQLQWTLGKCPANDRRDPDAYRKSPGGEEKGRRIIVSISCFQDICSRNQVTREPWDIRQPKPVSCPRMQASALRLCRTREA